MEKPSFKKTSAAKLDERLEEFFIRQLGYSAPIRNDPDEAPGDPHYWRMVYPLPNSRPLAVAYQANLSTMRRQDVARLYVNKVVPHRDSTPAQPAPILYVFTDGARYVFFSADTARNRDDRFDLSEETWQFEGVKGKVEALRVAAEETPLPGSRDKVRYGGLVFQKRLGKLTPQVEFLFDSKHLSADDRFKNYVREVRRRLMQEVVTDGAALAAVIYHLLETPEARDGKAATRYVDKSAGAKGGGYALKKSFDELHLELKARLGDAVAAAVDTLLLRYVMVRFLEAYHPEAMEGLLGSKEMLARGGRTRKATQLDAATGKQLDATLFDADGTRKASQFSEEELDLARLFSRSLTQDASLAKKARTRRGEAKQGDLFIIENTTVVLEEEAKRETRLGGDFYLADLGQAARGIEEAFLNKSKSRGSMLLQDFLGRTGETADENGSKRWDFRYEDLKPKTLQDYYEDSLSTAVQLTYHADADEFRVEVGTSNRQRKELGAYYTNEHLCRFMVERTVKPLFDERLERLRVAVERGPLAEARAAFEAVMSFSVCDPTMGSAPFLRSAFDYLVESTQYFQLHRHVAALKARHPALYEEIVREYEFLGAKGGRLDAVGIGGWEWHVLRRVLYGVDIDLKAVCIACQTFALSSMRHLKQGERFPSYFNINLKLGNALISPTRPADRARLAAEHGGEIAKLISLRRRAQSLPNTEEAYAELVGLFREADRVRLPMVKKLVGERVYPVLEDFTDELRPFSWELEFPEIFFNADGTLKAAPGFDVVIGNPPWEEIDVNDAEFFGSFDPAYEGAKRQARRAIQEKLLENELIEAQYAHARARCDAFSKFVNQGGWYEYQKLERADNRRGFTPQNNFFRMAVEVFYKISQPAACISIVSPQGIVGDEGVKNIRGLFFSSTQMQPAVAFKEKNDVFTVPQAFAVTSVRKGGVTEAVALIDGLERSDQLAELPAAVPVPVEVIKRCSPLSWALIAARSPEDLQIIAKLHAFASLADGAAQAWTVALGTEEINETRGAWMWSERPTSYVMRKGEFTEAFRVKTDAARYLKVKEFRGKAQPHCESWRVVWRDVINESAERRMLWAVVPPRSGVGNSLNWLVPTLSPQRAAYLVCVMNSFVVEYRARQLSTNNHMSKFIVRQLPFPRIDGGDPLFDEIVERGLRLLGDFTEPPVESVGGYITYPGMETDEDKRQELQNEVDALVALAFGLEESDLRHILFSRRFNKVRESRKLQILQCFNKFAATAVEA